MSLSAAWSKHLCYFVGRRTTEEGGAEAPCVRKTGVPLVLFYCRPCVCFRVRGMLNWTRSSVHGENDVVTVRFKLRGVIHSLFGLPWLCFFFFPVFFARKFTAATYCTRFPVDGGHESGLFHDCFVTAFFVFRLMHHLSS